jgi:hypothetical protein
MMVHCQTKSFTGSSLVKNGMVVAKINWTEDDGGLPSASSS